MMLIEIPVVQPPLGQSGRRLARYGDEIGLGQGMQQAHGLQRLEGALKIAGAGVRADLAAREIVQGLTQKAELVVGGKRQRRSRRSWPRRPD